MAPDHPEGLAYRLGQPADPGFADRRVRARATAEFTLEVVRSAHALAG